MDLPARIGPYRILRRLGRGGMAEVFVGLAVGASGFEKQVALKTLLPELQGDATLERILIEEARLGARLSHRNLVGVHELGVDAGRYFVRMDLVDGVDLAALLKRSAMPPALALLVAEELCLALDYLHRATDDYRRPLGLVHRDVSPGNVLVSREGEVKLSDLGIAKATMLKDITQGGVRKGKYAYMSPEQAAGGALAAASDQFGLGITLAEMLTGSRPFDAANPVETLDRIREAKPPELAGIAGAQRNLVRRCLEREPERRFESAAALRHAVAAARREIPEAGPDDLAAWAAA